MNVPVKFQHRTENERLTEWLSCGFRLLGLGAEVCASAASGIIKSRWSKEVSTLKVGQETRKRVSIQKPHWLLTSQNTSSGVVLKHKAGFAKAQSKQRADGCLAARLPCYCSPFNSRDFDYISGGLVATKLESRK